MVSSATSRPRPSRPVSGTVLAIVMIVGCLWGFSPQVITYLSTPDMARPLMLWVHAIAMTAWLALYLVQTLLVRNGSVALHRKLGMWGAGLAFVLPFLMIGVSYVMDRFNHFTFGATEASPLIMTQVNDVIAFTGIAWSGLALRKRQEFHRRLMLIAAAIVTDAGFARVIEHVRLDFVPSVIGGFLCVDAIIGTAMWLDWKKRRRLHRVWLYAVPPVLAGQIATAWVTLATPQWWTPFWFAVLGLQ